VGVEVLFGQRKNGGNRDRLISMHMQPTQASPVPPPIGSHEPCPIVTPMVERFLATCDETPTRDVPRPPGV